MHTHLTSLNPFVEGRSAHALGDTALLPSPFPVLPRGEQNTTGYQGRGIRRTWEHIGAYRPCAMTGM